MALEAATSAALAKLGAMFAASAFGAAIIAAYYPETRRDTWWRAFGAGIGSVPFGFAWCRIVEHLWPWMFTGHTYEDMGIVATVLIIVGSLFWGLVGLLQNLGKKLSSKSAADALAEKIGL